jgi:prophage regulatory protein
MELLASDDPNVPYCNEHRRRLERAGKFPKRVYLSPQRYAYVRSEIEAWVRDRIAERDAPKAA